MGNIAHQFLVLAFILYLLLRGLLQTQAHILIITVQLPDFIGILRSEGILKVPFGYILHGHVQTVDGRKYTFVYPLGKNNTCYNENNYNSKKHIDKKRLGDNAVHSCNDKNASLRTIREPEVNLLHQLLHIIIVITGIGVPAFKSIGRQPAENFLGRRFIPRIIYACTFSY